jgi:hypothetical protein
MNIAGAHIDHRTERFVPRVTALDFTWLYTCYFIGSRQAAVKFIGVSPKTTSWSHYLRYLAAVVLIQPFFGLLNVRSWYFAALDDTLFYSYCTFTLWVLAMVQSRRGSLKMVASPHNITYMFDYLLTHLIEPLKWLHLDLLTVTLLYLTVTLQ